MDITVTLVDVDSERVIGTTDMAPADLPPDFTAPTTLHIRESEWRVEKADPPTRDEYENAGALRLLLRRVTQPTPVDPQQLRFSMSSVCDQLPDIGAGEQQEALMLPQDLWRDVEFIGPGNEAAILSNFTAIDRIYSEFAEPVTTEDFEGHGFTQIHVRRTPDTPLAGVGLTLDGLVRTLDMPVPIGRLAIEGTTGCVVDGFALPLLDRLALYGLAPEGQVTVVGLLSTRTTEAVAALRPLAALLARHSLSFVDWRGRHCVEDQAGLAEWLSGPPSLLFR